jgi:uracil-DNA glycosylase
MDRLREWAPAHVAAGATGWRPAVDDFLASPQGRRWPTTCAGASRRRVIYPPQPLRALELTPLASVHAVVLGQDPYHGPGQAEGWPSRWPKA